MADIEGHYDILKEPDGRLTASIRYWAPEPNNPQLLYNGKEHALLYRSNTHMLILDYVNPDVRDDLKKAKEITITEHDESDNLIRSYTASVRFLPILPLTPAVASSIPALGTGQS